MRLALHCYDAPVSLAHALEPCILPGAFHSIRCVAPPLLTSCAAQDITGEEDVETDAYEERLAHHSYESIAEPTWAELMDEVAVSSRQRSLVPGSDSQRDLEHQPGQRAWKASGRSLSAEPPKTASYPLPWWSEERPPAEQLYADMPPESLKQDEQTEGTANSQGGVSGRVTAWRSYDAKVSEDWVETAERGDPLKRSSDLTELQYLEQHAQELAKSKEVPEQEIASLMQQLERAYTQADAHALLQEKCAEQQWHITELEGSAQAQEARYVVLEQEHAQVQDRLDAQLEVIAQKATQQQQDLATALQSLTAAHADQQRLTEDKAALERQVSSDELQLGSVQSQLHTAQKAADQAGAMCLGLSGKVEALLEELARQQEADAGELAT